MKRSPRSMTFRTIFEDSLNDAIVNVLSRLRIHIQMKKFIMLTLLASSMLFPDPVRPVDYQKMMGVGINVDWVMFKKVRRAFLNASERGINVPEIFKKRGFSHVRIRVNNDVLEDPEAMKALKIAVSNSLKAGLVPVIAYAASDFMENPSEKTLQEAVNWWEKVATIFKDYPYYLSYDLIIETNKNIRYHNDLLNLFYYKVIPAIRKIDPYRIIFVTPNDTSNPCSLKFLKFPKDPYTMIQWHFYASGPSKKNPKKLWTTGKKEEKKLITDKINCALSWAKERGMLTWVGAWMPSNYNKSHKNRKFPDGAPAGGDYTIDEIVNFASFMSHALKSHRIPFAINADTKFFDIKRLRWYKSVSQIIRVILDP